MSRTTRFAVFAAAVLLLLLAVTLGTRAQAQIVCIQGNSGEIPKATLTFYAPTLNTDGTPIVLPLTYNVWIGTAPGNEVKTFLGFTGSPIRLTSGLIPGTTYYFQLSVVDGLGRESIPSPEQCKIIANSVPSTPGSATLS